jgi:hypothetical protein
MIATPQRLSKTLLATVAATELLQFIGGSLTFSGLEALASPVKVIRRPAHPSNEGTAAP